MGVVVCSFDPGLATFGLTSYVTDGREHDCTVADVFTSASSAKKHNVESADDDVRRARELARWLGRHLDRQRPAFVTAEAASYPQHHRAVVCMAMAWGVISDALESRGVAFVAASPQIWRKAICRSGVETDAWREGVRIVPTFAERAARIDADLQEHALDSNGVFCWGINTNLARAVLAGQERRTS